MGAKLLWASAGYRTDLSEYNATVQIEFTTGDVNAPPDSVSTKPPFIFVIVNGRRHKFTRGLNNPSTAAQKSYAIFGHPNNQALIQAFRDDLTACIGKVSDLSISID